MATLAQLREYVRRQTETTNAELSDATIDGYIREAFNRTINQVNAWPFYEARWVLPLPANAAPTLTLPPDVNQKAIVSLINQNSAGPYRMQMVDHETAEDLYLSNSAPTYDYCEFSLWGGLLYLWPATVGAVDREFTLRAYRLARDWVQDGEEAVVDADPRLHWPLTHYAIALAYAQQEDEVLESTYMQRWQMDIDGATSVIMEPVHDLPLTMGGGKRGIGVTAPAMPVQRPVSIVSPTP